MKRKLIVLTVGALAVLSSCTEKKTTANATDKDSTSVVDTTATDDNYVDLAAVSGTYEGTLPAADCPGIKTVLTIKADSTYQLQQDYIDKKNSHDEASGVFKVLDGKVLMLVRPSNSEQTYYKVKDNSSIVMTDSLGVEPEGETAKLYVLKKK
ncbi:copper resistance protein NlpE [uncultured Prevotella sp.]|uniref:copper resistance protein NlpE n=1 Tax=uncultured Prevotella sp. TaxID=159272 RepID=UPI0026180313|nr:copper resistance protein NlpE [uncultured Prevotella sp.]